MAYLDRSQGITFVHTNFYKLYKKAQKEEAEKKNSSPIAFSKENSKTAHKPSPIQEMKANLEKLSLAQKKLHFLLGELKSLYKKK